MTNIETTLINTTFKNPIWVASGTFGYAREYEDFIDLNTIGAIVTKTITLNPKTGNPPPRIIETSSGMLNAIGLTNIGIDAFIKTQSQYLKKLKTKIIISIAGNSKEEFVTCINKIEQLDFFDAIELNLSCPNIYHKMTKYKLTAQDADTTKEIISAARKTTQRPLIAKLTPQVTDITLIAKAAEESGADAVALSNTYPGMAVDIETMSPVLGNITGGLSGPAIKPMALKVVFDAYKKINIPIIGIGGIMTGEDVVEFMLCGASAVQVGTANFVDPTNYTKILNSFKHYLNRKNIKNYAVLIGRIC